MMELRKMEMIIDSTLELEETVVCPSSLRRHMSLKWASSIVTP